MRGHEGEGANEFIHGTWHFYFHKIKTFGAVGFAKLRQLLFFLWTFAAPKRFSIKVSCSKIISSPRFVFVRWYNSPYNSIFSVFHCSSHNLVVKCENIHEDFSVAKTFQKLSPWLSLLFNKPLKSKRENCWFGGKYIARRVGYSTRDKMYRCQDYVDSDSDTITYILWWYLRVSLDCRRVYRILVNVCLHNSIERQRVCYERNVFNDLPSWFLSKTANISSKWFGGIR